MSHYLFETENTDKKFNYYRQGVFGNIEWVQWRSILSGTPFNSMDLMEQRKYILDKFQDHLRVAYEAYCARHGLEDTNEQFVTFLIDQDLISPTQLQRYTVIQEFEKLRSEHQCPKTQAVDTLANRFRLSERTIWGVLRYAGAKGKVS